MLCSKCGTNNVEGAKFCVKCGLPIISDNSKPAVDNMNEVGGVSQNSANTLESLSTNNNGVFNSSGNMNGLGTNSIDNTVNNSDLGRSSEETELLFDDVSANGQFSSNNTGSVNSGEVNSSVNNQNISGYAVNAASNLNNTVNTQNLNYSNQTAVNNQPRDNGANQATLMNEGPSNGGIQNNDVHNSIIRKAIKKEAKATSKGALAGIMAVLFIMPIIILTIFGSSLVSVFEAIIDDNMASMVTSIVSSFLIFGLLLLVYLIISWILSFGMVKSSLAISRGNKVTFGEVLKAPFKDFGLCLKFILGIICLNLVTVIPFIGIILLIYLMPALVVYMYVVADDNTQDKSFGSMVKRALELVKGHRIEFYGLMISFIGWLLLSSITFGLLMIWLMPYIMVSMANFYRYLIGEASFTNAEKGLSNGAIIGIGIAGYLLLVIGVVMAVVTTVIATYDENSDDRGHYSSDGFDASSFDDTYQNYFDEEETSGNVQNMSGLNILVPDDYNESSVEGYDLVYMSGDGLVLIGGMTENIGDDSMLDVFINSYKSTLETSYSCQASSLRNFDGQNWSVFNCGSNDVTMYNYITSRNGNVYVLVITASNLVDVSDVINGVEENLSFTY